jgi:hypothetical protein
MFQDVLDIPPSTVPATLAPACLRVVPSSSHAAPPSVPAGARSRSKTRKGNERKSRIIEHSRLVMQKLDACISARYFLIDCIYFVLVTLAVVYSFVLLVGTLITETRPNRSSMK